MTKGTKRQRYSKNCLRIRGRHDLFIKGQILVNFAPLPKKKHLKHTSTLPTFNHDSRHFTLAFHLPSSQRESQQLLQEDHNRRVRESLLEISQIYYPKPRSRHRYCGVCRGYYEDYKEHVESEKHQEHLGTSQFQRFIKELAKNVQEKVTPRHSEEERIVQTLSEEQIYKCLSTQTLEGPLAKVQQQA